MHNQQPPMPPQRRLVLVCQYRSCQRNGAAAVLEAFRAHPISHCMVAAGDCTGQCSAGPTVRVMPDQTWYCRVRPEDVGEITEQHLSHGQPVRRLLHPRFHPYSAD